MKSNAPIYRTIFFLLMISFIMHACKRKGCMDPNAPNYNPKAKVDDGSCPTYDHSVLAEGWFHGIKITGGYHLGTSQWGDTLYDLDFRVRTSGFDQLKFDGFILKYSDSLSNSNSYVFVSDSSTGSQWESESIKLEYFIPNDSMHYQHSRGNITDADWTNYFGSGQ